MATKSWAEKYWEALDDVRRWTSRQEAVVLALRMRYAAQRKDADTIDYLINHDQEVAGCQDKIDKALAAAAAYGPAALLERLSK